ncbi:MAG: integration host factor subunit beta [Desulfobacterales bacterium]|nr:integration host factor subunit beta [Desulfobacterales bacterium]
MVKSELITAVAQAHPGIYKNDITEVVETIFKEMGNALMRGETIDLRRFGSFRVTTRRPVSGKNPKTGKPMEVPAHWQVHFKLSNVLKTLINTDM